MHTPDSIAAALEAEFVIHHRAGMNYASKEQVADYIADLIRCGPKPPGDFPKYVWAYYTNGGRTLRFTLNREDAELNADGFKWDRPRVRKVGIIQHL